MSPFAQLRQPAQANLPLGPKTSFGLGGPCLWYVEPEDVAELRYCLQETQSLGLPWFILGRGTNLIVPNEGFPGVALHLAGNLQEIQSLSPTQVIAGAGIGDSKLARWARHQGLAGFEFLSTVPGTLGGAIFMNAGAHGQEIAQVLDWADLLTPAGELLRWSKEELGFGYRTSKLQGTRLIVLQAQFSLHPDTPAAIKEREQAWHAQRKQSQPIDKHTFGSLFKNPPGHAAWKLIKEAGFQGKKIGAFQISLKHANFVEHQGGGRFEDLLELVQIIQDGILQTTGIQLQMEAEILRPKASWT